jgi:uncharacterized membrane protein YqaE (UPF0057 family)
MYSILILARPSRAIRISAAAAVLTHRAVKSDGASSCAQAPFHRRSRSVKPDKVVSALNFSLDGTLLWSSIAESVMDVLRILLAIVLPPLGVFLQVGLGLHFWLNILLTLLGYIPGIIHAVWIILKR